MTAPNRMSLGVDGVVGATGIEPVTLPSDPITVAGEPVGGALPAAITGPTQQGLTDIAASQPRAPGAYLGHGPGDSKGQQRYRAVSRDPALSSGEGSEQPCSWRHAVYGMQGVRGSNPLSSTPGQRPSRPSTARESSASGSRSAAICSGRPVQRPARRSRRPASLASSSGRPGPTRAGPAARYGIWRCLQAPRAMALVRLQMDGMYQLGWHLGVAAALSRQRQSPRTPFRGFPLRA